MARCTLTLPLPQAGEGLFKHMLMAFACDGDRLRRLDDPSPEALRGAAWIDLISPSVEESSHVQAATGLRIPTQANLSEIESSSRLAAADGVLTLSMPLVSHLDAEPRPLPGGFVLARDRLITRTCAPKPSATSAVASVEPSSITRIWSAPWIVLRR